MKSLSDRARRHDPAAFRKTRLVTGGDCATTCGTNAYPAKLRHFRDSEPNPASVLSTIRFAEPGCVKYSVEKNLVQDLVQMRAERTPNSPLLSSLCH
jgi:hypothetical protein